MVHPHEEGGLVTESDWPASPPPYRVRTPAEIARFFEGFELVEPGLGSAPRWRPDPGDDPAELDIYAGLGVKR